MANWNQKRNRKIQGENIKDGAVKDAIDQINRRFADLEKRFDFARRRVTDPCPVTDLVGPTDYVNIPGLDLTIPTRGGSVFAGLQFSADPQILKGFNLSNPGANVAQVAYRFVRDGFPLPGGLLQIAVVAAAPPTEVYLTTPPNIFFIDENLSPGKHQYRFQMSLVNAGHEFSIGGVQLVLLELG